MLTVRIGGIRRRRVSIRLRLVDRRRLLGKRVLLAPFDLGENLSLDRRHPLRVIQKKMVRMVAFQQFELFLGCDQVVLPEGPD